MDAVRSGQQLRKRLLYGAKSTSWGLARLVWASWGLAGQVTVWRGMVWTLFAAAWRWATVAIAVRRAPIGARLGPACLGGDWLVKAGRGRSRLGMGRAGGNSRPSIPSILVGPLEQVHFAGPSHDQAGHPAFLREYPERELPTCANYIPRI